MYGLFSYSHSLAQCESMGSVLVVAMVPEGLGEPQSKKLHPFFNKGPLLDSRIGQDAAQQAPTVDEQVQSESSKVEQTSAKGKKKRPQRESATVGPESKPKRQRRKKDGVGQGDAIDVAAADASSDVPHDGSEESHATDFPTPPLSDIVVRTTDSDSRPAEAKTILSAQPATTKTPPKAKKVLKFNSKTGTLGSPPKPKPKPAPTRIVSLKYGHDAESRKEMGDKITQILDGTMHLPSTPKKQRKSARARAASPKPEATSKTTHPFFTGQLRKNPLPAAPKETEAVHQKAPPARISVFMSTPVSPKKPRVPFNADKIPQFGMKPIGTKVPGAMHPLWPAQGMSHIRGFEYSSIGVQETALDDKIARKSKGTVITISPQDSIINQLCERLNVKVIRDSLPRDPDAFEPVPVELRIPEKYFESGRKLQQRIRSHLRTYRGSIIQQPWKNSENDDLGEANSRRAHPAIIQLFEALESTLSAYDRSTCENQAWTTKYAPTTASQVIQAGREALLLRDWLQNLQVQSVDTGGADCSTGKGKGKSKSEATPKKRRKKNKLDGFIVDSDEEANEMDEVSENEDDWAPAGSGVSKKTVIRSGDATIMGSKEPKRMTNAVVISGPHGSGKTATVYAIAKELGFEVFEINSGSRRSGKDILEKVGDMTRNHLVHHRTSEQPAEEDTEDEVARDLKSGKQGMMTAFFKPKASAPPKKPAVKSGKPAEEKRAETTKLQATRNQKQSLILLEEVDVLYKEDREFWATLMGMITQSKRPFIMTCHDETVVPLQSLKLHGIFRFTTAPVDLAVDLCLLMAANEGHALCRDAVDALYSCRGNDLRATITELQYWCQIGVGDRRGGFDWFYPRWPKGSDLDEDGNVVRVVSGQTYMQGMGFIGRDLISSCPDPLEAEDEALRQCWDAWGLDAGDWQESLDLESWTSAMSESSDRLQALEAYDSFCGSMSDADFCSAGGLGTRYQELVDPTLPEMSTKAKDDFTIGRRLLEADPQSRHPDTHRLLSMSLKSLARHHLLRATEERKHHEPAQHIQPITETTAVSILENSINHHVHRLSRLDLAFAFDPIAVSEKAQLSSSLDPSVFDRTLKLIVLDVAPWVRGIVEYDYRLMQERLKLSNLLSEGGKRKRMRTTRSAYSALEGGERKSTRREKYFGDCLNTEFVRRTRGKDWHDALMELMKPEPADDLTSTGIPSSPPSVASSLDPLQDTI